MSQNCYAYAIQYPHTIDPGELSGRKYRDNSDNELISASQADGLQFTGSTTMPGLQPGSYIVALIATSADRSNYHWLRRESDSTWSHKPGQANPQKRDATETPIDDGNPPHRANFNYRAFFMSTAKRQQLLGVAEAQGWALDYDRFVGYFYCPDIGLQPRKKKGECNLL